MRNVRARVDALEASAGTDLDPIAIFVHPLSEDLRIEGAVTGYGVVCGGGEHIVMRLPGESDSELAARAKRTAKVCGNGLAAITLYQIRSAEGFGVGWWQAKDDARVIGQSNDAGVPE